MLAPDVLTALGVVVEDFVPGPVGDGRDRRLGQDKGRFPAVDGHAVELGKAGHRELDVGRRVLAGRGEEDPPSVGREAAGDVGRGMEGQAPGFAAAGRHEVDVEIAGAVGGKGDPPAVMAPDRGIIVGFAHGQGNGRPAGRRDFENVALGAEKDGLAVRRDGRVPQPQGIVLGGGGSRAQKGGGEHGQGGPGRRGPMDGTRPAETEGRERTKHGDSP